MTIKSKINHVENMIVFLNKIVKLSEAQENKFISVTKQAIIKKNEWFITEGEIPKKIAFVSKGLFRYFYIDKKGNELTKGFFPENTFISSYSAMIQNRQSYFTIQAIEESTIFVISYENWASLIQNDLSWHQLLIALLEKGYGIKESREREFLLLSAEERYRSFLNTHPDLEKRIKQHLIASYLGITPVALSRIRKNMKVLN